jgi:hypothetical protein
MNKGDKVICIKDWSFDEQEYKKDIIYEIDDTNKTYGIYIKGENYISRDEYGYWFCFKKDYYNNFPDYFITLAEWRQQQINSILDEGN